MTTNRISCLLVALLGVALLNHPGVNAKIRHFQDDQGVWHITDSVKPEPPKPGTKPTLDMSQARHPESAAPETPPAAVTPAPPTPEEPQQPVNLTEQGSTPEKPVITLPPEVQMAPPEEGAQEEAPPAMDDGSRRWGGVGGRGRR